LSDALGQCVCTVVRLARAAVQVVQPLQPGRRSVLDGDPIGRSYHCIVVVRLGRRLLLGQPPPIAKLGVGVALTAGLGVLSPRLAQSLLV
jgi:hypothetical protein